MHAGLSDLSDLTFFVKVFGCQMNRSDAERIAGLLISCGASEASSAEAADAVIFITCTVRENAAQRIYGQVSSMKGMPAPAGSRIGRKIVAVGGCIGQNEGESLIDRLPNVDVVFGTHNIDELPALLAQAVSDGGKHASVAQDGGCADGMAPIRREARWRAWLPIMKGCDNFCSYCIVPYVRGREMSRPLEDVAAQAAALVADGVREITLLGQNVNSYGRDLYGEPRFAEAIDAVAATGIERLRFVTSHPKDISDATIEAMARHDCVMPALHLPVQSGSDRILAAMNRGYTAEQYLERVSRIRRVAGDIALSTDVIVGFPGESEEDFQATYDLVREVGYSQVFTFLYSPRSGTPAASMENDEPREDVQRRFGLLVGLVQESAHEQNQKELGSVLGVLVEGESKRDESMMAGKSPKNQTVHFPCPEGATPDSLVGRIVDVRIDEAKTWYLSGVAL